MIRIEKGGLLTTVQDLGRWGHQGAGVSVGGAMDPLALRLANILVGNEEGDACLEITLLGPAILLEEAALIALTGADLGAAVNGQAVPTGRAIRVPAGARLSFGQARSGCRTYLAIAGGLNVPVVLGSRSTYLLAGIGGHEGRALHEGDAISPGTPSKLAGTITESIEVDTSGVGVSHSFVVHGAARDYSRTPTVRFIPAAVSPLMHDSAIALMSSFFTVSTHSDRTGYRLDGAKLELATSSDPHSAPVTFGTVQLPADGNPIILMADRQTTGGYPRLGEVATADLPKLAQLKPGDRVSFETCTLRAAQEACLAQETELRRARRALTMTTG